jgi:hypothetical protein
MTLSNDERFNAARAKGLMNALSIHVIAGAAGAACLGWGIGTNNDVVIVVNTIPLIANVAFAARRWSQVSDTLDQIADRPASKQNSGMAFE